MLTMTMRTIALVLATSLACTGDGANPSGCLGSGTTCARTTANPGGGCCSEMCEARGMTSVCACLSMNARCTAPQQCCSGSCTDGRCLCRATGPTGTGDPCTSTDQCCDTGQCRGGRCTCRTRGESCTIQDCCSGLTCGSGAPGGPTCL